MTMQVKFSNVVKMQMAKPFACGFRLVKPSNNTRPNRNMLNQSPWLHSHKPWLFMKVAAVTLLQEWP
jgi:hypothetical protein